MWGWLASPRPAGLGVPPRGHHLLVKGSDHLLESVVSWFLLTVATARPAGLPRAHLGLWFCRDFALPSCILQGSGLLDYIWSRVVLSIFRLMLKPFGVSG